MENEHFEQQKEMQQANEIINQNADLFEPPKSKLHTFDFSNELTNLVNRAAEDYEDPLKAYRLLVKMEKKIKAAKELILDAAIIEAEKFSKEQQKDLGFSVSGGGKYDYSVSEKYKQILADKKQIETEMKLNFKRMENGSLEFDEDSGGWFDPDGGVAVPVPIYNKNKTALKFTKL